MRECIRYEDGNCKVWSIRAIMSKSYEELEKCPCGTVEERENCEKNPGREFEEELDDELEGG